MAMSTVSRMGFWLTISLTCPLFFSCGWGDLGGAQAIGRPCALSVNAGHSQGVFTTGASECPSSLCLKPAVQPGATPPAPDTGPSCSGECSDDSDCAGELRDPSNPLDTRCAIGFTCGIPFVKGSLCCKKLCVCKDFLTATGLPTPIACTGSGATTCSESAGESLASNASGVQEVTGATISATPDRQLDLVTMVDNSPGMAPKIEKLNAQFSKLIAALKDPTDGTLPDLRVAIIDSDLGTGNAYSSGSCGPKTLPDGSQSPYGDLGRFQMIKATDCGVTSANATYLEYIKGTPVNFKGDINTVFACLAGNLGTLGCGEEHPLQAFEFALIASGLGPINDDQHKMLRPNAYLGLVFLTDEDDCSAAPNDEMFGEKPELRGESASLRCYTRSHACNGIPLTTSPPGPGYPTTQAFSALFKDCSARADSCDFGPPNPNYPYTPLKTDDGQPTPQCSPLKDIKTLANEIKGLKSDSDNQIFVAGIFGWPMSDADMAMAEYKIAPIPNPNTADTAHPTVFDSWPVCYDPNHLPAPATTDPVTGFDATAAAWGATAGLRESALIDEFGTNGMKLSICEPDFSKSMESIGKALARKLLNVCFDRKLVDTDLVTPGIQADCRVVYMQPIVTPAGIATYAESPTGMPQCSPSETTATATADCWQLTSDLDQCPATGQRITLVRPAAKVAVQAPLDPGIKLKMQCRTCPALAPGSASVAGCDY